MKNRRYPIFKITQNSTIANKVPAHIFLIGGKNEQNRVYWKQQSKKETQTMQETTKIGCLVMAAGNSTRYRGNKLAALLRGKPIIEYALDAVPTGHFAAVTVVTQYPEIEEMAARRGFRTIRNEHPDWGISHTIRLGTEAMKDCNAILYMVADQPLLDDASVERILECWRQHPCNIVGASHNGKRGNPCIFPKEFFEELMQLREDHGGNTVIRRYPDRLLTVEVAQEELTDVDTPEALEELKKEI